MEAKPSGKGFAVGIDLGTTYSCVGTWKHDRVEIIPNEMGNRTTPSYVSFDGSERLIGEAAYNQAAVNPTNTVFDAKRMIGRKFADEEIQRDIQLWPFKVVQRQGGKPFIQVQYMDETKEFAPEEISAMVLTKMKSIAEAYLGGPVTDAVITCPAYFNDAQRVGTKNAGMIAGFNVLRILNEPTAAAIAYGLEQTDVSGTTKEREKLVLVFDYGGGTLDVSILSIDGGIFEVKATGGDTHLGGEDLDNEMVTHLVAEWRRQHKTDLRQNQRSLRRLRTACERAKRTLSSSVQAAIEIDSLYEGIDFYTTISRAKFEELCAPHFRKCLEIVIKTLYEAKIDKSAINEIVLVGGSTRIPKVQSMLEGYFEGKRVNKTINPDEAVAYGAAVQAAVVTGTARGKANEVLLLDVTPLSLGIATQGDVMAPIIDRNTTVPVTRKKIFSTTSDNQTTVNINVYEGERPCVRDNNFLGTFMLDGIRPAKRAVPQIEVTFTVDTNGILNVTAQDLDTKKKSQITITNDKGRLSKEEVDKMLLEAERFKDQDKRNAEILDWRIALENKCHNVRSNIEEGGRIAPHISDTEKETLTEACRQVEQWLAGHPQVSSIEPEEIKAKTKEFEATYNPIFTAAYAKIAHESAAPQQEGDQPHQHDGHEHEDNVE